MSSQPNSSSATPDDLERVKVYQKLVLEYEALDEQIDSLLAQNGGATENMSPDDFEHYRQMARQRDDVYSRMKALEQQLFGDDDTESGA